MNHVIDSTDEVVTLTDGGMWMEDSLVTAHQPLRPIRQVNQVFYSLSDVNDEREQRSWWYTY